jgi:GTP 3',8-cyclase
MTPLPDQPQSPDQPALVDRFGRRVSYVRLSVTDRCDFRCVYCMAEDMQFLPRSQVLTLEELGTVAETFVGLGVEKIRITGGEPLIRKNVISLFEHLGQLPGLRELTLTTNGSQLPKYAQALRDAGVKRINISLDSLDADRFRTMTRTGNLHDVLAGIKAAQRAGFTRIKLNSVILKNHNDDEVLALVNFARNEGLDISFIEEMPLGKIDEHDRAASYISSDDLRTLISSTYPLLPTTETTPGPSRYYRMNDRMNDSASRIGFISPHSHNFCASCNRVRVTVEGRLLLCLGNEHSADLRSVLRTYPGATEPLRDAIIAAMDLKPEKHHFNLHDDVQIVRFMNSTGG